MKIYLGDDKYVGEEYELCDIGETEIEDAMSKIKGRGIMIFIPERKRKKSQIGIGL